MKYIFCTDMTGHQKHTRPDGQCFLSAELPQVMRDGLEQTARTLSQAERRHKLPGILLIMQHICLGDRWHGLLRRAGACACGQIGQSRHKPHRNAPGIFWIGAVTLCIAGLLALWQRVQTASADRSSSVQAARRKMNDQIRCAKTYLGIPGQVQPVDILLFDYRREAQGLKILNTAHNTEFWIYRDQNTLCIADEYQVHALALQELQRIRVVQRGIPMTGWNKGGQPDQARFQRSGVMCHEGAAIGLQFCCALELTHNGEQYALLFPGYELPEIQKLTRLSVPELPAAAPEKKRKAAPKKHPPNGEKSAPLLLADSEGRKCGAVVHAFGRRRVSGSAPTAVHFSGHPCDRAAGSPDGRIFVSDNALFPRRKQPMAAFGRRWWFLVGCSLFNILAAWLHQYFGHIVTICLAVLGFALMAISCLLL
ncbi:MAG: hypothetical protein ACLUNO_11885 [Oscillospiraceae bacterium]